MNFKHRYFIIGYLLVFLFAISPMISVTIAGIGANMSGCETLHEGSAPDCPNGDLWYSLGVMGWFFLLTFPLGFAGIIVLAIIHIVLYTSKKKKEKGK